MSVRDDVADVRPSMASGMRGEPHAARPLGTADVEFALWLKRSGIRWDGLTITRAPGSSVRGSAVLTTQPFDVGEALAVIPKSAVLSIRTAACAAVLHPLVTEEGIAPDAALNVAVAHERMLGVQSRWYTYLRTLPAFEPLPALWPDSVLTRLLKGTGIDEEARHRRRELQAEYRQIVRALRRLGAEDIADCMSCSSYVHAASLTSSRAFYVDAWHGEALVPFADLLNHKSALVPEGASLEGDGDEGEESNEEAEEMQEEEEATLHDARVASVRRREAAHRAALSFGVSLEMDTTLHNLEAEEGEEEAEDNGHVALVALRPLPAAVECFNTYGEHGNRRLLSDYGFTLKSNPLDVAELPWRTLLTAASAAVVGGERAVRARERELRGHFVCGSLFCELVDGVFGFDIDGTPPAELLLAMWWLLADPAAAPPWMAVDASTPAARSPGVVALRRDALEAARDFLALELARQLLEPPPTPTLAPLRDVLRAAIRAHATSGYSAAARAAAAADVSESCGHRCEDDGLSAMHLAPHVGNLVRSEMRIWEKAEERLACLDSTS